MSQHFHLFKIPACGWEPMAYGNYAALIHALRAVEPEFTLLLAGCSYEIAVERGIVFG